MFACNQPVKADELCRLSFTYTYTYTHTGTRLAGFHLRTTLNMRRDPMRTPASVAGHPIHPMLIVFPVGLLIFSLVCDLISLVVTDDSVWATVALYTMVGGFIGALLAAVPGLIDLLS